MSLINEALKKAQSRQASAASAAGSPAQPVAPGMRVRSRPVPRVSNEAILLYAALTTAFVLVLGAAFFGLRWIFAAPAASYPPPVVRAAPVESAPAPAAAESSAEPIRLPQATSPSATEPPAAVVTPPPAPQTETAPPQPASTPAPRTAPDPVRPAAATGTLDPELVREIYAYSVVGIREEGDRSRVFMNDRIYRLGDVVDHARGLVITGISQDGLTFRTPDGRVYERRF